MDPVVHVPPQSLGYSHLASEALLPSKLSRSLREVFYDADLKGGFTRCEEVKT